MIEVEHLTKFYGVNPALQDVSFKVADGEILGFLGPNGAGKTTAMRILTCFMPASGGTARINGLDVFSDSLKVREQVGYMPESVPIYKDLTVNEYLRFVAEIKGVPSRKVNTALDQAVSASGLGEVRTRIISKLSKGYRQRVGLAQALISNPKVLILDEPTVGLDPKQIIEIREMIKNLGGERTVILSTHILPEVSMTCERVIIINEGRIVAEDTPEKLTANLKQSNRIIVSFKGEAKQGEDLLKPIAGVRSIAAHTMASESFKSLIIESDKNLDLRPEIARRLVGGGLDLMELRMEEMSLEDIFIKLVTEE